MDRVERNPEYIFSKFTILFCTYVLMNVTWNNRKTNTGSKYTLDILYL